MENIFVERLWRSLKYQEVYLNAYATIAEVKTGIGTWSASTMKKRQHQSLGYRTLRQIYQERLWICGTIGFADRLRFPRFQSKLGKRGNARLRPHTPRAPQPTKDLMLMK